MKIGRILYRFASLNTARRSVQWVPMVRKAVIGVGLMSSFWLTKNFIQAQEFAQFTTQDNFTEGEVREIQVGPKKEDTILVIKYQGEIYSTQSKCAHYGFSLAKGLLVGDKLICPLHNAGFSIKSGAQDQGPVFDGLKTFPVKRVDGKVIISVPKVGWETTPAAKEIGQENVDKSKQIVIIGSGPAALSAAETMRNSGYMGQIIMVSKEKQPFDRTVLSKGLGSQAPSPIRSRESLKRNGIIIMSDSTVTGISKNQKQIQIENKPSLKYDKLLIATGSVNKIPKIEGLSNTNFHTLRGVNDYTSINESLSKPGVKNVTIIGAGFIGMQIASAIKLAYKENINITVLQGGNSPLQHVLGKDVGVVLQRLSQKNGVKVITGAQIKSIQSRERQPIGVNITSPSNTQVSTDVLIVATGVQPALGFVKELIDSASLGIKTNAFLQSQYKDVYAAGDVASYPYWYTGETARVQHFNEAIYQGSIAALNMVGKKFPMDNIPFFWTRQFNNSLAFTGVTKGWDEIHVSGSLEEMKFVAYYIRKADNKVLGAASMGQMNSIQIINQAMRNGVMPSATEVKNADFSLEKLLSQVKKANPKCTRCAATKP